MQPDRDDDGDLRVADATCVELVEERWHEHCVRRRTREIGHSDDRVRVRSRSNRVRGQVPEAFASERGLKTTNCLRGKVRDRRGRARLDDVEVEPRLQHELELFFPVRDGEVTRAVGHG